MRTRSALLALALAAASAVPALAAPAPRLALTDYAQLKTPLPFPYDEAANADHAVAVARARAKAQGKRLLIDLGGNWCGDCRVLAGTIEQTALKRFVEDHFVLVTVDVGRFDKNLQIPAHYGIHERLAGVPALLVVDPRRDRLLNTADVSSLADARHMTPQSLADYLARWSG